MTIKAKLKRSLRWYPGDAGSEDVPVRTWMGDVPNVAVGYASRTRRDLFHVGNGKGGRGARHDCGAVPIELGGVTPEFDHTTHAICAEQLGRDACYAASVCRAVRCSAMRGALEATWRLTENPHVGPQALPASNFGVHWARNRLLRTWVGDLGAYLYEMVCMLDLFPSDQRLEGEDAACDDSSPYYRLEARYAAIQRIADEYFEGLLEGSPPTRMQLRAKLKRSGEWGLIARALRSWRRAASWHRTRG